MEALLVCPVVRCCEYNSGDSKASVSAARDIIFMAGQLLWMS
jgi:hypothetical protein